MSKFDKIAKSASSASPKSERRTASVTDAVKAAVDVLIALKAKLASIKAEQQDNQRTVIDHVWPQYVENARKGDFTKSLEVPGNTGKVTFVQSDAWSIPQDEPTLAQLKKLLGDKFDKLFVTKRSISIEEKVLEDEKLLDRIATACEKAGMEIDKIFKVGDKVCAVDDLDRKQFSEVPEKDFEAFRALVKQFSPALK